jgi:hypothetical protein
MIKYLRSFYLIGKKFFILRVILLIVSISFCLAVSGYQLSSPHSSNSSKDNISLILICLNILFFPLSLFIQLQLDFFFIFLPDLFIFYKNLKQNTLSIWRLIFLLIYCFISYIYLYESSYDNSFFGNLFYFLIPINNIDYFEAYRFVLSFYGLIYLLILFIIRTDHEKLIIE